LLAIAPNFNFIEAFELCGCNFATQRGRRFLSSTLPSSEWAEAEDVMKSDNPSLKPIILPLMNANAFADELFPSVSILRRSRIDILFLQGDAIRFRLPVLWINACRRSVQVSIDAVLSGRFDTMKID
jgi:hypothetical protein